jgi:CubicO group peptidase (beta-lactamase class C family)
MTVAEETWPTDGWPTSTPEEQGMDAQRLAEMLEDLQDKEYDIHSLLIVRNGHIVMDVYLYPYAEELNHDLYSVTKSFVATLIGIAKDKGYIESVLQPVLGFFPDRTADNLDADKEAMALADLLMMSSGWECPDDEYGSLGPVAESDDWVQAMLDLPMQNAPGERFEYCNASSHLLSAIIHETTGLRAMEFAQEHLFGPLGITSARWQADPQGNHLGWSEMYMTPHDMARLGYLYLHGGFWDGEQVVSADWVEAATTAQIVVKDNRTDGYGYQWWTRDDGAYMARGFGGQYVIVIPDKDMVVVFTASTLGEDEFSPPMELLNTFIIPAAESDTPLPDNPDAVAKLESLAEALAAPEAGSAVTPETAQRISARTFAVDENPAGLVSFMVDIREAEAVLRYTVSTGPDETQDLEIVMGLGNVYHLELDDLGFAVGARGWWESDNVFVVERRLIGIAGEGLYSLYSLAFAGDQVTIEAWELESGETVMYSGTLEE